MTQFKSEGLKSDEKTNNLNARLVTKNLIIEPLVSAHAIEMFPLMQDALIYEWISSLPPTDINKLMAAWKRLETRLSLNGDEFWLNWVVRRLDNGAYLGKLDATVNHEGVVTNLGYFFFPSHFGRGYATESVLALTQHLAHEGISKIIATVTKGNLASCRVLEKCGYTQTRIIPENDTIRGVKYDDLEYVFIRK
jgi:RimJ/RimL family protein N-acetyltransferase